jgi:HrpA-like RNA helicase
MKIEDIVNFPFMDPPDQSLLVNAALQLYFLGALDDKGHLTSLGDLMTLFPLSPHLSRALIASTEFQCSEEMIQIVAMLSSEDVYQRPKGEKLIRKAGEAHDSWKHHTGDHLTILNIYIGFRTEAKSVQDEKEWCRRHFFNWRCLRNAREVERQLRDIMQRNNLPILPCPTLTTMKRQKRSQFDYIQWMDPRPLLKSLLTAYFINLAKRHARRPIFYHCASTSSHSALAIDNTSEHHTPNSVEKDLHTSTNPYLLALSLHPSSALLKSGTEADHHQQQHDVHVGGRVMPMNDVRDDVDWVIYHELMYTQRAHMRVSSKVLFEWVDEVGVGALLDRKRKGRVNGLSLVTKVVEPTREGANTVKEDGEDTEHVVSDDGEERRTREKMEEEEEEEAQERQRLAEEAKQRFLERQKQKTKRRK